MKKKLILTALCSLVLSMMVIAAPAMAAPPDNPMPGKPDFNPHIYADGEAWGTKIGPLLPMPNGRNNHSFDMLFPVLWDGGEVQMPVAEAAPGNPDYNGGRWAVYPAVWNVEPHATFTFYEEKDEYDLGGVDWNNLAAHVALGHLTISAEAVKYFECPLLPVK